MEDVEDVEDVDNDEKEEERKWVARVLQFGRFKTAELASTWWNGRSLPGHSQ